MKRPAIHFTPQQNWMNDPNGLFYLDGQFHLYYQYHPYGLTWGPMHWGHASSTDLLDWMDHPIALEPDELGQIFSGSMVLDQHNDSGLFAKTGRGLIAFFTHHNNQAEAQSVAISVDGGYTFTKYADNPIVEDDHLKDFRDPKVFYHEASKHWIMVLACGDHLRFYRSTDLLHWTFSSHFKQFGRDVKTPLECPDLFVCRVDGESHPKWVLKVDVANHPAHGPGALVMVGSFDGLRFTPDPSTPARFIDHGQDFYAAASWANVEEVPFWIGWLSNWRYANEIPHPGFRGTMTLPRELKLKHSAKSYDLIQQLPHSFYESLGHFDAKLNRPLHITAGIEGLLDLKVTFTDGQYLHMQYHKDLMMFTVDRSHALSGWSHEHLMTHFEVNLDEPLLEFECVVDANSCEVFLNSGKYAVSLLHFVYDFVCQVDLNGPSSYLISNVYRNEDLS